MLSGSTKTCRKVNGVWWEDVSSQHLFVSQQHGSVYWRTGASETLARLDPGQNLYQLLQVCVSTVTRHVWLPVICTCSCVCVLTGQFLSAGLTCVDGLQQQTAVSGPAGSSRRSSEAGRDHRVQSL